MSESAPERSGGKGNFWTQKVGGMPMLVWGLLVVGGIVGFMYIRNKSSSSTNTNTSTNSASTADQTAASQVPQFVNQTFTNVAPPEVTVNNNGTTTTPTTPPPTAKPPTTTPKPPAKKKVGTLGPPGDIKVVGAWTNSGKVTWAKVNGATGYSVRVTYQEPRSGKSGVVNAFKTKNTYANIGNLAPDHTYTVHVATVNSAGTGAESNGPELKTAR